MKLYHTLSSPVSFPSMLPLEHTQTQAAICSTYTYYVGPVRFLNEVILISLKKFHS